jgi:hypothetical protein
MSPGQTSTAHVRFRRMRTSCNGRRTYCRDTSSCDFTDGAGRYSTDGELGPSDKAKPNSSMVVVMMVARRVVAGVR